MKEENRFLVVKKKNSKEITYFDYDKLNGYQLRAKNDVKFEDAINISRIIIINPSFCEKLADHRISYKFENFINLITIVCENDDEGTADEGYRLALNEASRLRMELINKYRKYINDEKLELYLKKISILEDEIKLRQAELYYYQYKERTKAEEKYEKEEERGRKSR